jgi:hypothetical protein
MRDCKSLFVRPTKRVEAIFSEGSQVEAWEVVEEWAKKIKRLGIADRFGVFMQKNDRGSYDVFLTDRSIAEDKKIKGKKK